MNKRALFLDRDGVINIDHGYVHKPEDVEFVDGIFDLVAKAKRLDYLVIVVTNQAGIGRGYYTEEHFHRLMDWMQAKFVEKMGTIDAVYFCPHHPHYGIGEYRRESEFRKPAPGMLLQAQSEWCIEMKQSILIGDSVTDMDAGRTAGVGRLVYLNGGKMNYDAIIIHQLADVMSLLN